MKDRNRLPRAGMDWLSSQRQLAGTSGERPGIINHLVSHFGVDGSVAASAVEQFVKISRIRIRERRRFCRSTLFHR